MSCVDKKGWQEAQEKTKQAYKDKRVRNEEKYYESPNCCNQCEKVLDYDRRRNKYCSSSCSAKVSNKGTNRHGKNKHCLHCDTKLDLSRKKYCNSDCQHLHQYNQRIIKWKNGDFKRAPNTPVYIRRYMLEKNDNKCQECGWSKINSTTGLYPLHVDHIDGDSCNHVESNLRVLCPSCHSLTPNYGALNKGNSKREYRNKWRLKYKKLNT